MHADAGSPTAIVDALLPSGERTTIRIVDGTVASVGAAALPGDVIVGLIFSRTCVPRIRDRTPLAMYGRSKRSGWSTGTWCEPWKTPATIKRAVP